MNRTLGRCGSFMQQPASRPFSRLALPRWRKTDPNSDVIVADRGSSGQTVGVTRGIYDALRILPLYTRNCRLYYGQLLLSFES